MTISPEPHRRGALPIFKETVEDTFEVFGRTRFPGLERKLEDWIEKNPHLLFPDETVMWFGRQVPSSFGKPLDLLGFDKAGACVVVELKRGMTPREVIAQTLEYTAWVDSLGLEELNAIAKAYASRQGKVVEGVEDLYRQAFPGNDEGEDQEGGAPTNVTFNARQRMVVVAEEFSGEIEQTMRYLRTRLGVDISGVRLAVHVAAGEKLVDTEVVVGRERLADASSKTSAPAVTESHEQTKDRVASQFVREKVDELDPWVESFDIPGLLLRHMSGSHHGVWVGRKKIMHYYFAQKWIRFWLNDRSEQDVEVAGALGSGANTQVYGNGIAFNVSTQDEFDLVRPLIARRLETVTLDLD